jgi:hypothetical protein
MFATTWTAMNGFFLYDYIYNYIYMYI